MAAEQLIDFLETGSIKNSVNFPMLQVAPLKPNRQRLCLANVNEEGVLSKITAALADVNIAKMFNKSQGSVAYTIVDVEGEVTDAVIEEIEKRDKYPYRACHPQQLIIAMKACGCAS